MSTFGTVLLASILACLVTTIGIYTIGKYEKWGNQNVAYFMSFAAGVLISISFIHIIPKSFGMNDTAPIYLLVGFMGLYVFNRFLNILVCHDRECANLSTGIIPMIGIGLHSFIDGIIYSVTFNVSIFTVVLAAIGMVFHEFPEGVVTFLLLERAVLHEKDRLCMLFWQQPYLRRWVRWFPSRSSARLIAPY
jgi:zinc transporter ZupT